MRPLVVTMAYGPAYEAILPRFVDAARAAGFDQVNYTLDRSNPPATPLDCWKQKPRLIRAALQKGLPVLWADVDFVFRRPPTFGFAAEADAALYESRRGVFEDGVMLWNPTAPAIAALARWEQRCQGSADWTNTHLAPSIREASATVVGLPVTYHWVERWHMSERFGRRDPVIEEVPLCGQLVRSS